MDDTHCGLQPQYCSPWQFQHTAYTVTIDVAMIERNAAGLMTSREQMLSCVETCHHPFKTAIIVHGGICNLVPPAERGRMMPHLVTQQNHLECFPCFAVTWRGLGTRVMRNQRWEIVRPAVMSNMKACAGLHGLKMCVGMDEHWLFWDVPWKRRFSWKLQAMFEVVKWSPTSLII